MKTEGKILRGPNGKRIVGFRLKDGGISRFSFHPDPQTPIYELESGKLKDILKSDGESVVVDEEGQEWLLSNTY